MSTIISADNIIASAIANATSEEVITMLDRFDLNWEVIKQPLILPDGMDSGFVGLRREGTDFCYASVRPTYEVYQNAELAELLIRICEKTGYEVHNGGMFDDGAKVYLQLMTGTHTGIGKNHDTIKKLATAINFHDYNGSMRWGATNITISCGNTFNAAYRQLGKKSGGGSARHSKNMRDRIADTLRELEGVAKAEELVFEKFTRMAEIPATRKDVVEIVKVGVGVDMSLSKEEFEKTYKTYKLNRMHELLASINAEMVQKGETLWGLFSGLTHYTSHVMPSQDRMQAKYIGTGFELDNKGFASILQ